MANPLGALAGQGLSATSAAIQELTPEIPPLPEIAPPDLSPLVAALRGNAPPTIDQARLRMEQSDATRRRRGRRASILTGPEGVAATPVGQRTLIGT
jgi:hypothetical protein